MSPQRTALVSILMVLTLICLNYLNDGEHYCPNKPFSTFPKQIGDWIGEERHFDKKIYDALGVTDTILRSYSTGYGHQIELYVGFYQSQREGELIHSPRNCMPGAGWNFAREEKLSIDGGTPDRQSILVNNILLQKGSERQIMFYWFQGRSRYISSEYLQKIYLVIDSITKRRTDEAFIRITAPVIGRDEKETVEDLKNFTRLLMPLLQEYLPS
ncbi:MAG: exosortase C-terminal domain/associated protein EpsI [Nitrospirota bacterium]